ncbi:alpha/beta hydrolase [Uliginosibacterium gangwonense]|uniref:alpha/beta hydrolase n=1 Tax=Uliginosibacterium gangwonense TaxID=392736 RepID=UPI00036ECACC|nr:alpha/beta hydrolase [Uliginosibacterium gangwonense]
MTTSARPSVMRCLEDRWSDHERAPMLLVFLQGAYTTPEDFLSHGFVAQLRQRRIAADVILADVNPLFVSEHIIVERLHQDVIAPAIQNGYDSIWLMGVSLGAFCALAYAARHAYRLQGLCLLSPYPGTQDVLRPIRDAGGLKPWAQTPVQPTEDEEHAVWRWLADYDKKIQQPQLWMGTGDKDRFLAGQKMMAGQLPSSQVHYIPGDHGWAEWESLWQMFLNQGLLNASLEAAVQPGQGVIA